MVSVGQIIWGPGGLHHVNLNSTHDLNDADNSDAVTILAPKTGTITHVRVSVASITGDPPAYNVGLVLMSLGNPTVNAYGGSLPASYDFGAAGVHRIALANPAAANLGDLFAVRVWPGGIAPDALNFIRLFTGVRTDAPHFRWRDNSFSVIWSYLRGMVGPMAVEYDDGSVYPPIVTSTILSQQYETAGNPEEVGALFSLPFSATCIGCVGGELNGGLVSCDWRARILDLANNELTALAVNQWVYTVVTAAREMLTLYWPAIDLVAGTQYRLGWRALTAGVGAGNTSFYYPVEAAAQRAYFPSGDLWQWTQRNAGAFVWVEDPLKVPVFGLILSELR